MIVKIHRCMRNKTINNSCRIISVRAIMTPDVKMRSRTLSTTLCVCNIHGDRCGSILHYLHRLDSLYINTFENKMPIYVMDR